MKGYDSLKQVIADFGLYKTACSIELGRSSGRTITALMRKRIDYRIKHASTKFKSMLKNRGYSKTDLMLIAAHDQIYRIYSIDDFMRECFMKSYVSQQDYKKLLASNALKSGRLPKLNSFLPKKITSKQELLSFFKLRRMTPVEEFSAIASHYCRRQGRTWFNELLCEQKIHIDRGMVQA